MPPISWEQIITVVVALIGSQGLWTWLMNRKGKYKKIEDQLRVIQDEIDALKKDIARQLQDKNASDMRRDILAFDSSLRKDEKHTQEEFTEVLNEIDDYEKYCFSHPDYKNNKGQIAIANIKETYAERQKLRDYI